MGREITNGLGLLRVRNQIDEANRLMREIGFTSKVFHPESTVGTLSGGERQGVAIARSALVEDALRDGTLVRPFAQGLTTDLAYYVCCLPERAEQPRIARFREWLLEEAVAK